MKAIYRNFAIRVALFVYFLLYPFIFLSALPWAWIESLGEWGYTTFRTWQDGFRLWFQRSTIRDFFAIFTKPLSYFYL